MCFLARLAGPVAIGFSLSFLGMAVPSSAPAQEPVQKIVELTESGKAYRKTVDAYGIDTTVQYFDPNGPAPELKTDKNVEKPDREDRWNVDTELDRIGDPTTIITIALLALVAFLFFKYGGAIGLSARKEPDEGTRSRPELDQGLHDLTAVEVRGLAGVRAIKDRRRALIVLLKQVFQRAAEDNDMRIERSWTAREALRRIPEGWPHMATLASLARDTELAYFGGRTVDEDMFEAHLNAAKPVLAGAK